MTGDFGSPAQLMIAALLIPWGAAVLIPLFHRHRNIREFVTLVAASGQAFVVWSLYREVMNTPEPTTAQASSLVDL